MARITIFDIDDTLVVTDATIWVRASDGSKRALTAKQFTNFRPGPGDTMDFSEFNCIDRLLTGKIVPTVHLAFDEAVRAGETIGVITAREKGDQTIRFLAERLGYDIDPNLVLAVNQRPRRFHGETVPEMKRQAIAHLIVNGYDSIIFYDDDATNLLLAKEEALSRGISFKGIHVNNEWREGLIRR